MPWYQRATKDVTSCEKLRGDASVVDPEMSEWGNPVRVMSHHLRKEGPTQGIETSQYLQEEKSKEIPSVAASESGRA